MISYIKVKWLHNHFDYPVLLYSELDDARWEIRKVEIWADGRSGYASSIGNSGETQLGIEPVPDLAKIASDKQFEPIEISKAEFEEVWAKFVS
jgi:hypothetical protein